MISSTQQKPQRLQQLKQRQSQQAPVLNFDRFKSMPRFLLVDEASNEIDNDDPDEMTNSSKCSRAEEQLVGLSISETIQNSDAAFSLRKASLCKSPITLNDVEQIWEAEGQKKAHSESTATNATTTDTVSTFASTVSSEQLVGICDSPNDIAKGLKNNGLSTSRSTENCQTCIVKDKFSERMKTIEDNKATFLKNNNENKAYNDTLLHDMLLLNDDKLRKDLSTFAQSFLPFSASPSSSISFSAKTTPTKLLPRVSSCEPAYRSEANSKNLRPTRESLLDRNTVWKSSTSGTSVPFMSKASVSNEGAFESFDIDNEKISTTPVNNNTHAATITSDKHVAMNSIQNNVGNATDLPVEESKPSFTLPVSSPLIFNPGNSGQMLTAAASKAPWPEFLPSSSSKIQQSYQKGSCLFGGDTLSTHEHQHEYFNNGSASVNRLNAGHPTRHSESKSKGKAVPAPVADSPDYNTQSSYHTAPLTNFTTVKLPSFSAKPTTPKLDRHDVQHTIHNIAPVNLTTGFFHVHFEDQQPHNTAVSEGRNSNAENLPYNTQSQQRQRYQQRQNRSKHTTTTTRERIAQTFTFQQGSDGTDANERQLMNILLTLEQICPRITDCHQLRKLTLTNRNLIHLNNLKECFPMLDYLNVSHNALRSVSGLPCSLIYLYISDNNLVEIDLNQLDRLQHLDISHNLIRYLDEGAMSELKSLRKLDAGHNKIISCKPFRSLAGLVSLNLRNNSLKTLKPFKQMIQSNQLETLNVSFNRIENLDSIEHLPNLRELYADHNDIMAVTLREPMLRLLKLQLSFNRLKSFDLSAFPETRVLYLDENQIQRVVGMACVNCLQSFSMRDQGGQGVEYNLQYLRGIRKLYLSGSPFDSMHRLIDFYSLEYLELCSANIEQLPAEFSRHVPNLATLYLSNNRLTNIKALKRLKYLRRLVLIENQLMTLNEVVVVVRQMKSLHYLDLRDNPMCADIYPRITIQLPSNPAALRDMVIDDDVHLDNNTDTRNKELSPYVLAALDQTWEAQDEEFRRNLSRRYSWRRQVYRSLLIEECSHLMELDHLPVTPATRKEAKDIMRQIVIEGRNNHRTESSSEDGSVEADLST